VKKQSLIEIALLYHPQALEKLRGLAIIPPRLVVTAKSAGEITGLLDKAPKPTRALIQLMRSSD
jgi:hypothetical protein